MRGAAILDKQIEERAQERRRQEELRDQERQQMVAELERMKEEELEQQHEKRIAANKLVRETARANAAAIDKKKWLIQAEKEEDARIARYIKEKVRFVCFACLRRGGKAEPGLVYIQHTSLLLHPRFRSGRAARTGAGIQH